MRTLGPGSVSSLLKIVLDVVYVGLWIGAFGAGLAALAALLFMADPDLTNNLHFQGLSGHSFSPTAPMIVGGLVAATLYIAGILVIVGRLRRIFATLIAGDPFHPDNVRRLRTVGLTLAALELSRYAVAAVSAWAMPHEVEKVTTGFSLTTWFAVLVVFVLAEVFREGARLRREAELTI